MMSDSSESVIMMGQYQGQKELFSYGVDLERRARTNHLLQRVQAIIDFTFARPSVAHTYGVNGRARTPDEVLMVTNARCSIGISEKGTTIVRFTKAERGVYKTQEHGASGFEERLAGLGATFARGTIRTVRMARLALANFPGDVLPRQIVRGGDCRSQNRRALVRGRCLKRPDISRKLAPVGSKNSK